METRLIKMVGYRTARHVRERDRVRILFVFNNFGYSRVYPSTPLVRADHIAFVLDAIKEFGGKFADLDL